MTYFIKKMCLSMTLLAAMTISYAYGDYSHSNCYEQNDCQPCCQPDCGQFFGEIGLLYLRPYEGGLSSVCDRTDIVDTTEGGVVVSRLTGRASDPHFNWNPGFRLGAGYAFGGCNNCKIGAYWTHFNTHTKNHSDRNRHQWKLDYDVVDLLFGCDFDCSCFTLTPYAGVKFARIDQKLHTNLTSTLNGVSSNSRGHLDEDFRGVGPMVGLAGEWGVGCGLSLYGYLSIAALYGNFHVNSHSRDVFDTGININHLRKHTQACQAVLDGAFGVRWRTCVCNHNLLLQLGLEQHRFFNHNQFCGYGDLTLDGFSLSAGIEY